MTEKGDRDWDADAVLSEVRDELGEVLMSAARAHPHRTLRSRLRIHLPRKIVVLAVAGAMVPAGYAAASATGVFDGEAQVTGENAAPAPAPATEQGVLSEEEARDLAREYEARKPGELAPGEIDAALEAYLEARDSEGSGAAPPGD